jgi:hypothetical protein
LRALIPYIKYSDQCPSLAGLEASLYACDMLSAALPSSIIPCDTVDIRPPTPVGLLQMVVGISALQELVYSYVGTVVCQRRQDRGGFESLSICNS